MALQIYRPLRISAYVAPDRAMPLGKRPLPPKMRLYEALFASDSPHVLLDRDGMPCVRELSERERNTYLVELAWPADESIDHVLDTLDALLRPHGWLVEDADWRATATMRAAERAAREHEGTT